MRFLKYALFILIALVLIFFILGLVKPTLDYGHTVTVEESVKESWGVAMDETKHAQWLAGFISEDLISGEKNEIGSKYKVIVKPSPEEDEFEMTETIVDLKEFEYIELHFDTDFGTFDQKMSFQDRDDQTIITTESTVESTNLFMRSMVAAMEIFGGSFQKQEEENIEKLKIAIEQNKTRYYPEEGEGILD